MARQRKSAGRGGFTAALLYAGAALFVAAPSAGLALGALDTQAVSMALGNGLGPFTPSTIDPRLAELLSIGGKQMRFTPAGAADRPGRSITVAVRVDEDTARAITVRQALAAADGAEATVAVTRLAPTRYNLGASRGYQSFARVPELAKSLTDAAISDLAIPDLASFRPSPGAKDKPSRFNARIALEEAQKTGRDERSRDSLGDQTVDLGGSYSVTRNLEVTAGVRYSQDRDRLEPLTNGKQDSQAVYIGTQFSF